MKKRNLVFVGAIAGLSVLFAGCGASDPIPVQPAVAAQTPAPTTPGYTAGCVTITGLDGQPLCKTTRFIDPLNPWTISADADLGLLSFTPTAGGVPVTLAPLDKIRYSTSGQWCKNTSSTDTWLIFSATTYSTDCYNFSSSNGLYGTDGTALFSLAGYGTKVVQNAGLFRIGFRTSTSGFGSTWSVSMAAYNFALSVEHCERNGVAMTCPY